MTKSLLLLPGDGIGPEVIGEVKRLIAALALDIAVEEALFGGASIDATGLPITDETVARALAVDAVLMGAVGGPKWADQAFGKRPEAGLLRLRADMGVYANLRPARCFSALADASNLKREFVEGLDILFVRELVGGVYFGTPRGIEDIGGGERRGINTQVYTSSEIRRVARTAFELARQRSNRVCSAEKSNVMEAGLLWKEEVTALHKAEYADVELSHMLADNMAMQLVKNPKQFDVILTDNLFGDILSDEAAMLTGSLGMLPSAAISEAGKPALYEPIHGSAPDIAGLGVANPCAAVLSFAMALRFSLGDAAAADRVEAAVDKALTAGARTPDIGGTLSTEGMGAAIIAAL
ncbi:3-isopropylmalate dehydrogenase [Sphingosinicella microcystinivorans]|uniref:3-isopropylmalate dehydrogenase n=1 Tax=Sphingosinicella microcystinivorans TaxID=335406 RepID=A0AAD1G0C0_SPHMI|nr:3-isopropylmalate dehydrogenase [Sphingosinicella microcystinivorans]RKS90684.1 3-isopropylmalate dehydrogenase [Sphingosinicella microcystinivorans]BBE33598.1 3-isopropylmalate dehydrogenase [Sphingosinicella microcystinivorans]